MNNQPMHALASVITEKFIAASPKEAAGALAGLATHEVLLLIGSLKAQSIVAVLNFMDPPKAAAVLRRLPLKQASYVLARLEVAQAAKLWKEFSAPYQERLSSVLEPAFVNVLKTASTYAADSVGRVMHTDLVAVRTETKVGELVSRLKNMPRKKLPAVCFVTAKDGTLKGAIRTAELAFFNDQAVCGSVMNKMRAVHPQDSLTDAQAVFTQEETTLLPVVDAEDILLAVLEKESAFSSAPLKKTLWEKLTK